MTGAFTATGEVVWPVPPDWTGGVQETLAWLSDVEYASATAVSQHRALRIGPRRSYSFEVLAEGQERRVADMLLAGHRGAWWLPIWPDVQRIAGVSAGAEFIACATAGYDFVPGGRALLWTALNAWAEVPVASVEAGGLVLAVPMDANWPAGTRLYPLRRARVQDGAEEVLLNDALSRRSLTFDITEPCDWPALAAPLLYRAHLVLDARPDESSDPSASHAGLLQAVDNGTTMPVEHDLPGLTLRTQQSGWKLSGRAQHAWYRSLLYALAGRSTPIWVPSYASDLRVVAPVVGGSATLVVEWAGYTLFGLGRPNRQDVVIELHDGRKWYRRITDAVEGAGAETLTLDAPLDAATVAPHSIRAVSFLALSTLASDEVEIEHATDQDGLATSTIGWQAVVPDV